MNIKIDKMLKTPIYLQISNQMKGKILSGEIAAGCFLPSERTMAKVLEVHRNTVVKAYNELKDEDFIFSKQGIGYMVADKPKAELLKEEKGKKVNWINEIKDEYLDMTVTFDDLFQRFGEEDKISMGSGLPPKGMYDTKKVSEDIASLILEEGKNQFFYSPYKGDKNLRQKLVSFLSTKGIKATTGEIQVLTETNQALDFIVTLLIKPGDTVIMEEPVSPDAYRAMELAGSRIITLPLDEDGMKCQALEDLVLRNKPKLIYINSSFNDPTGATLSSERRNHILNISAKYRIPVVEDDAASELVYDGSKPVPLKALDKLGNVIYIYSFSLTFVPGLSLAFVVADKAFIRSMSYMVSVRLVASDWMTQKLAAKYLEDGSYYSILKAFRVKYKGKRDMVCSALDKMKYLGIEYFKPRGGVYVWCQLPQGIDSKDFINKAYGNGISLLPGYVFYPHKNGGRDHIRINYSFETEERLEKGLEILRKTLEAELAR